MFLQLLFALTLHTTLQDLSVTHLVQQSDAVVVAKAIKNQSYWQNKRIYTRTTFQIEDTWIHRNQALPQQVDVIQLGGMVGDIGQRVDGMIETQPNERVVLCLKQNKNQQWTLVGMSLGAFFIQDNKNVARRLKDMTLLKAQPIPKTLPALKQEMLEAFHAAPSR